MIWGFLDVSRPPQNQHYLSLETPGHPRIRGFPDPRVRGFPETFTHIFDFHGSMAESLGHESLGKWVILLHSPVNSWPFSVN